MGRNQSAPLTPWQAFYASVKDVNWPECEQEEDFALLPDWIRQECLDQHGYHPGAFARAPRLAPRVFPIKTDTACQLKWNWSTVFLSTATTASCHRTNHHVFDVDSFDFHNTPTKIQDRKLMLQGQWPQRGCEYCRNIEQAGGQSDRITNLDLPGMHAPPELDQDLTATQVTPRILEVYFNNTCNLKCVYCGPWFSSLWEAENRQHGDFKKNDVVLKADFGKRSDAAVNQQRLFDWLSKHGDTLTNFNILGGEPLYQDAFDQCLEFFNNNPCPDIDLQIFTNLNATQQRVEQVVAHVKQLVDHGRIRKFSVTASLDCWGAQQEYARFPLRLEVWQRNFEYLVSQSWLSLVVGSTITPLTVRTLSDLVDRLNHWRQQRPIHHYFNSVNSPSYMFIDIFGDQFQSDFARALAAMPEQTPEEQSTKRYLAGIAQQSASRGVNAQELMKLRTFLDEIDRRRGTDWRQTFPHLMLDQKIKKHYNKV